MMEDNLNIRVNSDRLWSDLMEVGKIGFRDGLGVTRAALSDEGIAADEWFKERLKTAGLEVRVDPACNIIGTLKSAKKWSDKILVIGSHLDTVPQGGMFDGALGVVAGLECARVIKESNIVLPWDLEVISFCDEEAAYNAGTVGSRAMIGQLSEDEIYRSKTKGGTTFADHMKRVGKDPTKIGEAIRDPETFEAILELHIEQGNRLFTEGIQIGAVTGIVGIYRYIVTVKGEANHAGTTPMHLRDDALVKAAPVFTMLTKWVREKNPEMVATIGQVTLEPGATNVIPGTCTFVAEIRSMKIEDMVAIRERLKQWVASHEGSTIQTIYEKDSVALAQPLIASVAKAAELEGLSNIRMPSGAGHDTQSFASSVPCGMIFIPCKDGKSHSPDEWIEPEQAANGCQVLLRTILELSKQ